MRLLAAACLCFGLAACEDPQPDVSAHTIMTVIEQTQGDPELLPLTLGALYEHVHSENVIIGQNRESIALVLGRDDQPEISKMRCHRLNEALVFGHADPDWEFPTEISQQLAQPLENRVWRVVCQFTYVDRVERVQNFLTQAEMWAIGHIGPAQSTAVQDVKTAKRSDPQRILSLAKSSAGSAYTASIVFLFELP